MKERPILFSGPMVRAILAGTKTQTRRVYKPRELEPYEIIDELDDGRAWPYWFDPNQGPEYHPVVCPYGAPGDRLWVREAFALHRIHDPTPPAKVKPSLLLGVAYRATGDAADGRWRSSLHMPRWASRLTLEVTGVRVERLQAITEEDARAEGIEPRVTFGRTAPRIHVASTHREAFEALWDEINAPRGYGWDANPWVWVVEFRRVEAGEGAA